MEIVMAQQESSPEKTQSGKQVAFGILGFMAGLILLLLLLKKLFM